VPRGARDFDDEAIGLLSVPLPTSAISGETVSAVPVARDLDDDERAVAEGRPQDRACPRLYGGEPLALHASSRRGVSQFCHRTRLPVLRAVSGFSVRTP